MPTFTGQLFGKEDTVTARIRLDDLPAQVRKRLLGDVEPVAATNPAKGRKSAAATPTQFACCRCGQTHPSLAAIERHAHSARHPHYRQVGVP